MRVPALFQHCSSGTEKKLLINHARSRCSSCSSFFARMCVRESFGLVHTYVLARVYKIVWNIWNIWNTVVFIGVFILFIWNSAGTDLEQNDD